MVIDKDTLIAYGTFPGMKSLNNSHATDTHSSVREYIRSHQPVWRYRIYNDSQTMFPNCNDPVPEYIADNIDDLTQPVSHVPGFNPTQDRGLPSIYCFPFQTNLTTSTMQSGVSLRTSVDSATVPGFSPLEHCVMVPPKNPSRNLLNLEPIIDPIKTGCHLISPFCANPTTGDTLWGGRNVFFPSLIFQILTIGMSTTPGSNLWTFLTFLGMTLLGIVGITLQLADFISTIEVSYP